MGNDELREKTRYSRDGATREERGAGDALGNTHSAPKSPKVINGLLIIYI
jgi:hypothetical protein